LVSLFFFFLKTRKTVPLVGEEKQNNSKNFLAVAPTQSQNDLPSKEEDKEQKEKKKEEEKEEKAKKKEEKQKQVKAGEQVNEDMVSKIIKKTLAVSATIPVVDLSGENILEVLHKRDMDRQEQVAVKKKKISN
jgi:predicted RND superfamily exporter protein